MIIVIGDRDFLFSLEVIGYFNGYCVSGLSKEPLWILVIVAVIVKYLKLVSLLSARMNACLGRVPPTGLSCSSLTWSLYAWMYWFFSFQELRSQGAKEWHSVWLWMQYFFQINWPSRSVAFAWMYWMYLFLGLSVHLHSLQEPVWIPQYSNVPILPDFVQTMSFYWFSSVEACLPGNTVLKIVYIDY